MVYHFIFIGLILFHKSYAQLGSCSSSDSKSLPRLCKNQDNYMSSEFPQPLPCQVSTIIKIKQLLSVNEADETITIFIEFQSNWIDERVGIRRSPENIEQNVTWYPQDSLNRVWTPKIYFLNAINIKKLNTFGDHLTRSSSYLYPINKFIYNELMIIKLSCSMDFKRFPLDIQTCFFNFTSMSGAIDKILLPKPLLSTENDNEPKDEIDLNSFTLPFQINMKAMESENKMNALKGQGYESHASIQITLERNINELENLMVSYYGPTGIFAFLSMISFFIKPEMVSRCL